jgi:hypothetical protein
MMIQVSGGLDSGREGRALEKAVFQSGNCYRGTDMNQIVTKRTKFGGF